jgi:hypothetical protein
MVGAALQPHDPSELFYGEHFAAAGTLAVGVSGAAVGALVGAFWRKEDWRSVSFRST